MTETKKCIDKVKNKVKELLEGKFVENWIIDNVSGIYDGKISKLSRDQVIRLLETQQTNASPNPLAKGMSIELVPLLLIRIIHLAYIMGYASIDQNAPYVLKRIRDRFGDDAANAVKPYLKMCYGMVRDCPGFDNHGMSSREETDSFCKESYCSRI